jgi:hypothetical protein
MQGLALRGRSKTAGGRGVEIRIEGRVGRSSSLGTRDS